MKAALTALLACASLAAQAVTYEVIDLGLGYSSTRLNEKGDVVGYKGFAANARPFRYLYKERRYEELDIVMKQAYDINDRGDIVGDQPHNTHGMVWNGKRTRRLPSPHGYGSAAAINNARQVTGTVEVDGGAFHAYLYSHGEMQDLGTLGGDSAGLGINQLGHVVGYSVALDGRAHAFLYRDGKMRDLGKPEWAELARAYSVNDKDVAVGWALGPEGLQAMLFREGHPPKRLGTLREGQESVAYGINSAGDIVGTSFKNWPKAFIHTGGQMKDLNKLMDPATGAGWDLFEAHDINDRGQITGLGFGPLGDFTHFLLTPIKPPPAAQ